MVTLHPFLRLFENRHKGQVINYFLDPIREGKTNHQEIIQAVKWIMREKRYPKEYHQILLNNLDHPDLPAFIDYYIKYESQTPEQKQMTKKIYQNIKNTKKRIAKYILDEKRPLSWSALSSWRYDPEQFFRKYILKEAQEESPEMAFGKVLATTLENGTCTIPTLVEHLKNQKEHKFLVKYSGIPLVGFADDFCTKTFRELNEVKTGKKVWDQKRADEHQQFDMYLLMNYITNKVKPEDVRCRLFWLPTQDNPDFSISFIDPHDVKIFETKRTMQDIIRFAKELKDTYKSMQEFVENHD